MIDNKNMRHVRGEIAGAVVRRRWSMLLAALLLACLFEVAGAQSALAATYYISPGGNDTAAGTSTAAPWKTFSRAWQTVQPGDTLLVMDGTYTQVIAPTLSGQAGSPITIRALNDGRATVDGQGVRRVLELGSNNQAWGNWFVIEGLVLRNGTTVAHVRGSHNILRRISAYNADTNTNASVILLWGDNNLVEDAIAAGTGRYMIEVYQGGGNTVRRAFAMWGGWDGAEFCGVAWPNGNNVGVYNASNTTVENVIAYGRSLKGIMVQANSDNAVADNNYVLGSMALLQGRDYDGSIWTYGTGQAQPTDRPGTQCDDILQWSNGGQRYGIGLFGQGALTNNVFRDVLAADNVGAGFDAHRPYTSGPVSGNVVERATLVNNGAQQPAWEAAQGGNIYLGLPGVDVRDSRIPGAPAQIVQGGGARFTNRYVNRQLTNQPLLPWSMESRAVSELGVSINAIVTAAIEQSGGTTGPLPTSTPSPATATPVAGATATPVAGATATPRPAVTSTPVAGKTPVPFIPRYILFLPSIMDSK